ncbi:MAG: YbfB/YjiJ family MFS transporter [Rhodospirillales bacterium]|nr:YbfB/YjiJ family MFS transporter [Rhodospirillales bacterium]
MPPWLRLSIAGSATLLVGMGIGRFSYTPLIPALIDGGALTASQAGYVSAFNLAGYLIGALAALRIRTRWGETRTLKACLVISLVCLIASIANFGFAWLVFWRFLVGVTVAIMMIYNLTIVTRHAPPGRLGTATGIVFTGVGVGILLSGTLIPALLTYGLAAAWTGLAVLGAAGVAIGFWGWGAADDMAPHEPMEFSGSPPVTPAILRLIAGQTMFSIGLVPHTIYWVDYLVRGLGHDMEFGGMHWVLFGLGAVSGTYLWGRLADRLGFRAGLVLVFTALAIGVALPVIVPAPWALAASSLMVGAQPGFSAIISGRTHQIVGTAHMAQVWRWMALISGVFQAAGGYAYVMLFDRTGSYGAIFLIGGAAMALGALISLAPTRPEPST